MKTQVPTSLALVFGVALAISATPRIFAGQDAEPTAQRGYPMYTPRSGYPEGDLTWKAGRSVGGAPIGILQFLADIPMQPGNVGNASTFDFPVIYRQVEDIDVEALVVGRSSEEDLSKFIAAAKDLEAQGVRAIAANCGFWANWQKEISEAVEVPFVSSSLTQLPMLLNLLPKSKKVMVLTFSEGLMMSAPALPAHSS